MYFENSFTQVSPALLRNESAQFNHSMETFHDIFQHTLNIKSGSRPPKIELTGILIPCNKMIQGKLCRFKLETKTNEYFLSLSSGLALVAKKIAWEDITVKGRLNIDSNLFDVDKMSLLQKTENFKLLRGPVDSYFELDQYKRTIVQRGKLDIASD